MSLTPSKRFVGWSNATFTPAGGTLVHIPGIVNAGYTKNPKVLQIDGDLDVYDTTIARVGSSPVFKLTTNKPAILDTLDGPGVFTIERWDAVNGNAPGGGGVLYTVSNSLFVSEDQTNQQKAAGQGSATIYCISSDGVTNPVSVSAL